jgi:hypothetical protein
MLLTKQEVTDTFLQANLEGYYNFLQDDLIKLANAFIKAAAPQIAKEERDLCIDVAKSVNHLVAEKIQEIRG